MARPVDLANLLFDGKLEEWLLAKRRAEASYDEISRELHERGVEASRETVRRWCRDEYGIEAKLREAVA